MALGADHVVAASDALDAGLAARAGLGVLRQPGLCPALLLPLHLLHQRLPCCYLDTVTGLVSELAQKGTSTFPRASDCPSYLLGPNSTKTNIMNANN